MMRPMTVFGVGPSWAFFSILYAIAAYFVTRAFPVFRIPEQMYPVLTFLSIPLLLVGILYYVLSGKAVVKAFSSSKLLTDGVYGICRHPLYGSWILFIVPGIELFTRSWLGLTTSVAMYLMLRAMVKSEEDYLAAKFGDIYREYKARIPFISPLGWLIRKSGAGNGS